MRPKTIELIRIAKQIRKAIKPFYSFALFVNKQIDNASPYTDTVNLIYDLVSSFDDAKDQLMSAFGLEKVRYEIQVSRIEPNKVVKEITNHTLNLIKMADRILAKTNGKPIKSPTRDDLLNTYLNIEEHIVLLIVWCNSYLNHIYN
ncbi:MAG: hypothetical protein RXO36_03670 [Candidatus Nanopusillus acidilobi]